MSEEQGIELPLSWVGLEELPILHANQVLIQAEPGEIIVTFGQVLPPPISAQSAEEVRNQLADIEYVPIRPLIRMGISPDRFRDIAAAMGAAWDKFEEAKNKRDPRSND